MKRIPTLLAVAATASLALTGCAGGSTGTDGGASDDQVRIGFIPGITSDPFFLAMRRGAEAAAIDLGVDLVWQGSADEWSPETQIPFVDSVLAGGVDALILNPTSPEALQPSVDKALDQNVPVVIVDQAVQDLSKVTSFLTGDNVAGGRAAGEELIDQIGGSGKVFLLGSSPTDSTNTLRAQGFQEVLDEHPDVELVGVEYQNSSAERATSIINTILLANPDLKGIFAVNGTGTTGAAAALRNQGLGGTVKLVGYDAYTVAVDALREGVVSALVAQQPAELGKLAVEYAYAIATGENVDSIEKEVILQNVVLTADNLEENSRYAYVE